MNRAYINWLESLPSNRKPQKVNQWMGGWAPLPEEIDLAHYSEIQEAWNQRDCPDGVMGMIKRIVGRQ